MMNLIFVGFASHVAGISDYLHLAGIFPGQFWGVKYEAITELVVPIDPKSEFKKKYYLAGVFYCI